MPEGDLFAGRDCPSPLSVDGQVRSRENIRTTGGLPALLIKPER
ncbi:hypothetical protein [Pseudochrobactrum kiredjianiae]|uniref:Uncharacterized protein n=1 Tax=Pseudochrobactrum kiredjianiae TaxID=386305 RepID=A0ABW3V7Y5_9HYPH|nr:hypothetical protein [Pseudochrobactrum kiredjianiae]MDM7851481.1 hypothetical protein [Pseudochrobactrum kiredjianiae]